MIRFSFLLRFLGISAQLAATADGSPNAWRSITPSTKLEYSQCFGSFQCARLLLPLDWLNKNRTDTVSIAIIKLPAVVPQDHPTFGGAIFVNPGGPGASGTDFLLISGDKIRSILDMPEKKHYEIISFDPRGVGLSEPGVDCYPFNDMARRAKDLEVSASGGLGLSPASFAFAHSTAKAFGRRCESTNAGILPFVNTATVARDMLAMVDKVAELRQQQETPRLQYFGFSYGTAIGNYFASLFPERVGRMALDSVVDCDDYANGPGWLTNTQDSDKMMEMFFEGCFNAGPKLCPLRRRKDKAPSDISQRTWSWINALDTEPIETTSFDGSTDVLLRSADIKARLLLSLRYPGLTFVDTATALAQAIHGDPEVIISPLLVGHPAFGLKNACKTGNHTMAAIPNPYDARTAVVCTDNEDVSDENSTYWKGYMEKQLSISPLFGDLWTDARLACAGWRVRPNWSFKGPFKTPTPSKNSSAPEADRPAAPLLFLSNEWDPVTPLRNARAMARQHPGAGVLVAGSMGHGALINGGECFRRVVSEYFDKGVVPKKEFYCNGSMNPWKHGSASDLRLAEWMWKMSGYNYLGV